MEVRLHKRSKMDSSGANELNLGFGFNDIDFSDLVLRLEIVPESANVDFQLKKIHINSLLLAYKSQFFYKLFKNGMKETEQTDEVALRIAESEEAAFMDLLKFIYDHSVNATSAQDLVDVLMAADKFEVPSCVRYCVDLLLKLPMSTELALFYHGLPSSVLANQVVQTLIESGKSFICAYYSDFTKRSQEEAMSLPLCAVEILLGTDDLQVDSEDDVFDFVLKWGRLHYPELEERRETLIGLLVNIICLPKMSSLKLKEVLDCSDFNFEIVWKPVVDALVSKDQDVPTSKYEYPRRIYNLRDVKVVQLQLARPCCLVFFDLRKKELADLVPFKRLYSQTFCLGGQKISLFAQRNQEQGPIGLSVHLEDNSESCTLAFDIIVLKEYSNEFTSLVKSIVSQTNTSLAFLHPRMWRKYFKDGILHLRVEFTVIS